MRRPGREEIWAATVSSAALGLACVATFWLAGSVVSRLYVAPLADHVLGGRWAVIATIFVFRDSYTRSRTAAVSRMAATSVSFVLCLIYLPFHFWALGLLIALSVLATTLAGRAADSITAAVSTTVVMVLAAVSPRNVWEQPIPRFADTLVGVVIGIAALSVTLLLIPHPGGSEST